MQVILLLAGVEMSKLRLNFIETKPGLDIFLLTAPTPHLTKKRRVIKTDLHQIKTEPRLVYHVLEGSQNCGDPQESLYVTNFDISTLINITCRS